MRILILIDAVETHGFLAINGTVTIQSEEATQAAHQAGRAAVMHAMVNGLLATQRLSREEVLAFFKTVRGALEEEVTNTGRIQAVLLEAGFEDPVSRLGCQCFPGSDRIAAEADRNGDPHPLR